MSTITNLEGSTPVTTAGAAAIINNNFDNLNTDKIETSYLDTDTTLAANSDSKIATQKAVKAYVDSGGNQNASETQRGIVEEATDAEVTAGTATGSTGAKLFVTPAKLATITATKEVSYFTTDSGYTATGGVLLFSNDASKVFTDGSYTKQKEIRLNKPAMYLRVSYTMQSPSGTGSYTRVYLNGVAVSDEQVNGNGTTTFTYNFTIPIKTNDLIQIYGYRYAGGGNCTLTNFRLYGDYANKRIYKLNAQELTAPLEVNVISTTNTIDAAITLA